MGVFARFADLLEYPDERLGDRVRAAAGDLAVARTRRVVLLPDDSQESNALERFGEEADRRGLTAMQEIYTKAFDFDDRCTLYVGHHLLAATARRGAFMARLAEEYLQASFACPEHELPDHLAVMLRPPV
jgi:nitrate reductase molybdenum cofactor assembly chaperone